MENLVVVVIFIAATVGQTWTMSHGQAFQMLQNAGINTDAFQHCHLRHSHNCATLEGIRENTVDGLANLKRDSNCPIQMKHSVNTSPEFYGNGYKAYVMNNACVERYIKLRFRTLGRRGGDRAFMFKSSSGDIYSLDRRGNYWDIVFY